MYKYAREEGTVVEKPHIEFSPSFFELVPQLSNHGWTKHSKRQSQSSPELGKSRYCLSRDF